MKIKCTLILIAFCALMALVSAQEYSIRANRGLNLRSAPSLNADIADTVRSGTILQVIGRFNRWLKIDRNGREVWLADWVDYSRVDSIAPPASPAPTGPIDNCCYVDRHCQSDLEWMAGWHAFQNGQCAASAQPQPSTPAQPVASAPANVDNCCYVDRQCQSDLEWMAGWHAFQNNHCSSTAQSPGGGPSRPRIVGSDVFRGQIEAALDSLQKRAPEWYDYVLGAVDEIEELPTDPGLSSCISWALVQDRKVISQSGCTYKFTNCASQLLTWVGILVHEACHIHTYEAGIDYAAMGLDEEIECAKPAWAASKAFDPVRSMTVVKPDLNASRISLGRPIIIPTC